MESDCSTVSAFVEKDESEDKFALVEIFRFFVNLTRVLWDLEYRNFYHFEKREGMV